MNDLDLERIEFVDAEVVVDVGQHLPEAPGSPKSQ
jgi:hypothetical protein